MSLVRSSGSGLYHVSFPLTLPSGSLAPARSALCGPSLVRIPSDGSQPSEVPWGEGKRYYGRWMVDVRWLLLPVEGILRLNERLNGSRVWGAKVGSTKAGSRANQT